MYKIRKPTLPNQFQAYLISCVQTIENNALNLYESNLQNFCLHFQICVYFSHLGSSARKMADGCVHGEHKKFPPYNFNQVLQNVDIVMQRGNPGAVGITQRGAQGTSLQDVRVLADAECAAGVAGGNGGGGSFTRLTVVGAKVGIDMRDSDVPTLTGVSLINSSCAAIWFTPSGHLMPLGGTGLTIIGHPKIAGVVGDVDMQIFGYPSCVFPVIQPHLPPFDEDIIDFISTNWKNNAILTDTVSDIMHTPRANNFPIQLKPQRNTSLQDNPARAALAGPISLVDSVIDLRGANATLCIATNGSLFLSNVYLAGCRNGIAVRNGYLPLLNFSFPLSSEKPYLHVDQLAFGRRTYANSTYSYHYSFPVYKNGLRSSDNDGVLTLSNPARISYVPSDLASRHVWTRSRGDDITWQFIGAVNALDFGAKGDGVTDDWSALQAALDSYQVVILPKGFYRISRPLALRSSAKDKSVGGDTHISTDSTDIGALRTTYHALVGVGRTLSFLIPCTNFSGGALLHVLDQDLSLVKACNSSKGCHEAGDGGVVVGFLTLATFDHLPAAYAMHWSATRGIWRQGFTTRWNEQQFPPLIGRLPQNAMSNTIKLAPLTRNSSSFRTVYNRALIEVTGGGAFYELNLDFGCCFGTLLPEPKLPDGFTCNATVPSLGAGIASLQEILLQVTTTLACDGFNIPSCCVKLFVCQYFDFGTCIRNYKKEF